MLVFENDYSEGCHPRILERLVQTNFDKQVGYGFDEYCDSAKAKIAAACQKDVDVWFLSGGTQTNRIVISNMIDAYQSVVAADTGHINVHEAAAIESAGRKVQLLPHVDGKLPAESLKRMLVDFYADDHHDHCPFPGMVYISHPTEYGTLYSKAELTALAEVCREYDMPLYMDGARLGYALACPDSDLTLPEIAELCDVFYIGGTKVGALCGEALVFTKNNTPSHFLARVKQQGGLLAKGRLLGIQFDALFTDGLYEKLGAHAIAMAVKLRGIFEQKGYEFHLNSPTNQLFVVLKNEKMEQLRPLVRFSFWEKRGETHSVVRFATSWATLESDIDALEKLL